MDLDTTINGSQTQTPTCESCPETPLQLSSSSSSTAPPPAGARKRKSRAGGRFRAYTATYFYKDEMDASNYIEALKRLTGIQYFIAGYETCPSTHRMHLQMYFQFKNPMEYTCLCDKLPTTNLIASNGSDEKNYEYCKKDGRYVEWGERQRMTGTRKAAAQRGIQLHYNNINYIVDEFREVFEDEDLLIGLSNIESELNSLLIDVDEIMVNWPSDESE